jgi:glycosyltransferase involved in cell wall biosynthesis
MNPTLDATTHASTSTQPESKVPAKRSLVSIVVPAFNEAESIQPALQTLSSVFDCLPYEFEIVVIDDGSGDDTFGRAAAMADAGLPVRAIRLSRNFGKEGALLAGLLQAHGDAAITIDADLQHPPSLIPEMLKAWQSGAKVVHAVKRDRGDKSWISTIRARVINGLLTRLSGVDVRNSSDYKLLDRAALDILTRTLPERCRFYRGLTGWIGFEQATIAFDIAPRQHGQSRWRLQSLLALALTALVSFTSIPLRIVSVMGLLTFLLGLGVGGDAIWSWATGRAVSGFVTIIITLLFIGSSIMISLGVIGEYIAKIYDEIKGRPAYVIDKLYERRDGPPRSAGNQFSAEE